MTPYIVLAAGVLLLGAISTYCWWIYFRVWVFRQDIFEIRDRLWDLANSRGILDDPRHREARETLNAIIRFAPRFSLATWLALDRLPHRERRKIVTHPSIPEINKALNDAMNRLDKLIFAQTASGLTYRILGAMLGHKKATIGKSDSQSNDRHIRESMELARLDRDYKRVGVEDLVGV
jgi:hypothetical protein